MNRRVMFSCREIKCETVFKNRYKKNRKNFQEFSSRRLSFLTGSGEYRYTAAVIYESGTVNFAWRHINKNVCLHTKTTGSGKTRASVKNRTRDGSPRLLRVLFLYAVQLYSVRKEKKRLCSTRRSDTKTSTTVVFMLSYTSSSPFFSSNTTHGNRRSDYFLVDMSFS